MIFGDEEKDSNGFMGFLALFMEPEIENTEELIEVLNNSTNFIQDVKERIRQIFEETKRGQVVKYLVYDITDEVDFGEYTIDDLN